MRNRGLTLMELIITLAVVAILTTLAWPSYHKHLMRSYRVQAIEALLSEASRQERIFQIQSAYSTREPFIGANGRYQIEVTISPDKRGYALNALPLGRQSRDPCGKLTIDFLGDKQAEGDLMKCWSGS